MQELATQHHHVVQLLGAYAVGACEPEEVKAVEHHLVRCPTCSSEAQALSEVAAWLAVPPVPVTPPSSSLRARILHLAQTAHPAQVSHSPAAG